MVKNRVYPGPKCDPVTVLNEMDVKYQHKSMQKTMLCWHLIILGKFSVNFLKKDNFTLNNKKNLKRV